MEFVISVRLISVAKLRRKNETSKEMAYFFYKSHFTSLVEVIGGEPTACCPKFQSVTICHGFISFSFQSLF
jgi:hypothetical protein